MILDNAVIFEDAFGNIASSLTQWDTNQKLILIKLADYLPDLPTFYFYYREDIGKQKAKTWTATATQNGNILSVIIPDEALEKAKTLMVYTNRYAYDTKMAINVWRFYILARPKPENT